MSARSSVRVGTLDSGVALPPAEARAGPLADGAGGTEATAAVDGGAVEPDELDPGSLDPDALGAGVLEPDGACLDIAM
jgi:hypothetical protein